MRFLGIWYRAHPGPMTSTSLFSFRETQKCILGWGWSWRQTKHRKAGIKPSMPCQNKPGLAGRSLVGPQPHWAPPWEERQGSGNLSPSTVLSCRKQNDLPDSDLGLQVRKKKGGRGHGGDEGGETRWREGWKPRLLGSPWRRGLSTRCPRSFWILVPPPPLRATETYPQILRHLS